MLRKIFFLFFFYFGVIFLCLILLPALIFSKSLVIFGGKILGDWCKFCIEFFLNTKIIIQGKENIVKKKFFIACAHQSQFETFFLQSLFNSPVFILKKELFSIPIFGWYLKKMGCIGIERNKVAKENLNFFDKIKEHYTSSNRPIIIFPQATRVNVKDRVPFKKGVKRIYSELNISCQPVALNSGVIWPKNGNLKTNKTLKISILKVIEPGINSDDFLIKLQKDIYNELDNMI
tara:strand:+ start:6297 stop:6995 length:699 start_codon:yes stop_codon:yes gene_type:complete